VHYRGIVHRDIKPANIMIARTGGVKVMDFGIARDTNLGDLTEAGTGIGTPAYMSPEQVLGDKLDARSDIFSLGVVLYQMVTGKKPFVEDEKKSAMHKIRLEKHTSARAVNAELPRELSNIIDRCLEKQPRDRWRSAQHMVMALERFLSRHVEMNHHARLVLFLKAQGVITDLEAEEYLNPAALGAGAGALQQPNLQARNVVRAGGVAHGIVLGFLLLLLGFIHVGPFDDTPRTKDVLIREAQRGYLRVDAYPWARVFVDNKEVGTTPIAKPLELREGKHVVRFEHDWYQPLDRPIEVFAGTAEAAPTIRVDFEKLKVPLRSGKQKPVASEEAAR
jgi:serine/threonine-protein kinase